MDVVDGEEPAIEGDQKQLESCSPRMVEFLQQEHRSVLKGLHDEIERLQRNCADLQFQFAFHGIRPLDEEVGVLQEKVEKLEAELAETEQQRQSACTQLNERSAMVEQMRLQLRQQEERNVEDVGARNLIIARLRKEVQEKANTISNLVKLLRVCPEKGPNLNREEVLRKAEAHTTSTVIAPMLTVFSPRRTAAHQPVGASQSPVAAASSSLPGKQLVEKYCRSAHNGNDPTPSTIPRRPNSLGLMPGQSSNHSRLPVVEQSVAITRISILEPWSPHNITHQSNGASAT